MHYEPRHFSLAIPPARNGSGMSSPLVDTPPSRRTWLASNEQALHFVFLGCGNIAARHARRLASSSGVRLSFASRDGARAVDFRRRLGGTNSSGSYAAALEADEVDVAVITTPTAQHLPLTL